MLKGMSSYNLKDIWWLNPIYIYTGFMLMIFYSFTIDSGVMNNLYGEPNYINLYDIFVYVIFFLAFFFGFLSYQRSFFKPFSPPYKSLYKGYIILIIITFLAYTIWFINLWRIYGASIVLNLLVDIGSQYDLFRDEGKGGKISGITTFTEIGIMAAPLGTYIIMQFREKKNKIIKISLIILFIVSALRAAIFAERIAMLEVVIPSLIVVIAYNKGKHRRLMKIAPVFGILFLFLVFGLFEYNRSWIRHYNQIYNGDIVSFVIDRVLGYYIVVFNTECIQVNFVPIKWFPQDTLWWLWNFPGMSNVPYEITGIKIDYLARWGNPEYNNNGGILTYYRDFWFFGVILQFFLGHIIKRLYVRYINRNFWGLIIFPIIIYGLLELPRYPFFSSFKMFFVVVATILFAWVMKISYLKKKR